MILSASRRTDIPQFYMDWFIYRLKSGYVFTRNPMNRSQISRIPLSPELIDCIVFWTKDAFKLLPRLDEIDRLGYSYIIQHTLTPYGRDLEPCLRDKCEIEADFIRLSKRLGKDRLIWRYDPIIINSEYNLSFHKAHFLHLCKRLSGYTDRVIISFVDLYSKIKKRSIREPSSDELHEVSDFIGHCARDYGLKVFSCCEKAELTAYGIEKASCIDRVFIERALGCSLDIKKDKNQREGCGCYESIDIGVYDTCPGGCLYCYANRSHERAVLNFSQHKPEGELLFGEILDGEVIRDKQLISNKLPLI